MGQITISIPSGFPTVDSIYHGLGNGQMFVRAYDNSMPTNPTPSQLADANGVTNN